MTGVQTCALPISLDIVAIKAAEKRRPVFVAVVFPFQFVEMPGKECQGGFLGERRLGDGSWQLGAGIGVWFSFHNCIIPEGV